MASVRQRAVEPGAASSARRRDLGSRLRHPAARKWFVGAGSGIIWQAIVVVDVVTDGRPLVLTLAGLAGLAVVYALFLVIGALVYPEAPRTKTLVVLGYWALTCGLFPLIGEITVWTWLLVVAVAVFTGLPARTSAPLSALVVLVQVAVSALHGFDAETIFAPFVTGICCVSFLAVAFIATSQRSLREAHEEIARLAVVEERARFARDLHDVLGHSLTVATVKAELARRLVARDPERAEAEIAEIEDIARGALADLRRAVSDYRSVSLETELAAAERALTAAGIEPHLPASVDAVEPRLRATFAWVLREGVTNVIRHSGASRCWVHLEAERIVIEDDGCGPGGEVAESGNGLRGLCERAEQAGATVTAGRGARGGFELAARLA